MSGYLQALAAVLGFTVLSVLLPVVGLFAGGCIVLLVLKLDWRRAGGVVIGACAALAVSSILLHGQGGVPTIVSISLLQWLPLLLLASLLRRHRSLSWPFGVALAVVAGIVLVMQSFSDVEDWWRDVLLDYATLFRAGDDLKSALLAMVPYMTGIALSSLALIWLLMLLLGRWWQSLLDAPGSFRDEFTSLQLGRGIAILGVAVFVISTQSESPIWRQLSFVAMPPFLLQGVAVAHGWLVGFEQRRLWLAAFYALLALSVVEPLLWLAVVVLGLAEGLFDLRHRVARVGNGPDNG